MTNTEARIIYTALQDRIIKLNRDIRHCNATQTDDISFFNFQILECKTLAKKIMQGKR